MKINPLLMGWYEIFSFFKKGKKDKLYCNYPECGQEITTPEVLYNKMKGEIYHNNSACEEFSEVMRVSKSKGKIKIGENRVAEIISREEALSLLRKGNLKQSSELEKKVEQLF